MWTHWVDHDGAGCAFPASLVQARRADGIAILGRGGALAEGWLWTDGPDRGDAAILCYRLRLAPRPGA